MQADVKRIADALDKCSANCGKTAKVSKASGAAYRRRLAERKKHYETTEEILDRVKEIEKLLDAIDKKADLILEGQVVIRNDISEIPDKVDKKLEPRFESVETLIREGMAISQCHAHAKSLREVTDREGNSAGTTELINALAECITRITPDLTAITLMALDEGVDITTGADGSMIIRRSANSPDEWYGAAKWLLPSLIGMAVGYAGAEWVYPELFLSPDGSQGPPVPTARTGAGWKGGLIGLGLGLTVSITWEAIDQSFLHSPHISVSVLRKAVVYLVVSDRIPVDTVILNR